MSRRWIRLDAEWEESGWVHALSGVARGCWPRLLCWVKLRGRRGRCRWPDASVLAGTWKVHRTAVDAMLAGALDDEAIRREGDELVVSNWPEYQEPDTTATKRKQRQRAKIAASTNDSTPSPTTNYVDVTVSRRDMGVTSRDTVTRPPTTDKEITTNYSVAEVVENSGSENVALSRFELLEEAKRECGMGTWGQEEIRAASSVLNGWHREGRTASQITHAIRGARLLVDSGKVLWERNGQLTIRPRQPFGLKALRNTFTLAEQGDGQAKRPFFDVALEEYLRRSTPRSSRGEPNGPERISVNLNLMAGGSAS